MGAVNVDLNIFKDFVIDKNIKLSAEPNHELVRNCSFVLFKKYRTIIYLQLFCII